MRALAYASGALKHRDTTERAILVKEHVAEVRVANIDRILKYRLKDWF
jgi:hypothetical protein